MAKSKNKGQNKKNKGKKGKGKNKSKLQQVVDSCVTALVGKVTVKPTIPKATWHQPLVITKEAYQKIRYIIELSGNLEVGGFGVAGDVDNLLRITDFRLIKQEVNSSTTELDDDAVNDYMMDMIDEGLQPCQCMRVWFHLHPFGVGVPNPSGQDDSTFKEQFDDCDFAVMLIFSKGNTPHVEFRQGENFYDMECVVEGLIDDETRKAIKKDYDAKVSRKSYSYQGGVHYGQGWQSPTLKNGGWVAGKVWDWKTSGWIWPPTKANHNRGYVPKVKTWNSKTRTFDTPIESAEDQITEAIAEKADQQKDVLEPALTEQEQAYEDYMYGGYYNEQDIIVEELDVEIGENGDTTKMSVMADGNIIETPTKDADGNKVSYYKRTPPSNRMNDLTNDEYARVDSLVSQTTKALGLEKKKDYELTDDEIARAMEIVLKQIDKEWQKANKPKKKGKKHGQQKSKASRHSTGKKDSRNKSSNNRSGGSGSKCSDTTGTVRRKKFGAG